MSAEDDDAGVALVPEQPRGEPCAIDFEGRHVRAHAGEPVAVALYRAGVTVLARSPKFHRPRGAFCLDGHCSSCALRIDGAPNRRSCMTPCRQGLACERQSAFPDADLDLLRVADWLFPDGMDHHQMLTGSRVANQLFVAAVRQMAASGTLPDTPTERGPPPPIARVAVDACVVGAGPAGLAAAHAIAGARSGARVLVVDEQSSPGGSLLAQPGGVAAGRTLAEAARAGGVRLELDSTAIAYYAEDHDAPAGHDGPDGVLAVVGPSGLLRVTARRFLHATGAYDQNLPFPESDRAGVLSARGCGRLVFRWGARPAAPVLVLTGSGRPLPYVGVLTAGLAHRSIPVRVAALAEAPDIDLGRETIAVAAIPAPASELPRQHGAEAILDPERGGFAVTVRGAGETSAAGVFAAGDVTGFVGPDAARAAGEAAGRALAASL